MIMLQQYPRDSERGGRVRRERVLKKKRKKVPEVGKKGKEGVTEPPLYLLGKKKKPESPER